MAVHYQSSSPTGKETQIEALRNSRRVSACNWSPNLLIYWIGPARSALGKTRFVKEWCKVKLKDRGRKSNFHKRRIAQEAIKEILHIELCLSHFIYVLSPPK